MRFPSQDTVEQIRKAYPAGTRVELIEMNDPYNTKLEPGSRGTVRFVDSAGTYMWPGTADHHWELHTEKKTK